MQLQSIRTLTGRIRLRTGLHIGAGKDTVEIGGLDQPIVKDPLTGAPYIPGSSIKGKMRSLLEVGIGMGENDDTKKFVLAGKPCGCGKPTCRIVKSHPFFVPFSRRCGFPGPFRRRPWPELPSTVCEI